MPSASSVLSLLSLLLLLLLLVAGSYGANECEPIPAGTLCGSLGYQTPRGYAQLLQRMDSRIRSRMQPLLDSGCSPDILAFACSLNVPVCTSEGGRRMPCRRLCESVNSGCRGHLTGLGGPATLDNICPQLPNSDCYDGGSAEVRRRSSEEGEEVQDEGEVLEDFRKRMFPLKRRLSEEGEEVQDEDEVLEDFRKRMFPLKRRSSEEGEEVQNEDEVLEDFRKRLF